MPANEIENRHAAGFSLQLRGGGGEVPANWLPGSIEVFAGLSIQDELIISSNPLRNPLVIVPLDRILERRRTLINFQWFATVDGLTRFSSPFNVANQGVPADYTWEQTQIAVQPMRLSWMGAGPDYSAPDWLPFNLTYGGASAQLPAEQDENLYDAIACLFPNLFDVTPEPTTTWATNLTVNVFEVPELEVDSFAINNTLPFFPVP